MAKQTEVPSGVFAPRATRLESKADATSTIARNIIDAEQKAQANKTARLRALRLAKEATASPEAAAPKRKPRQKASK